MHGCRTKCWGIGMLVVLGIAVLSGAVMLLWNWLLPGLFGVREIGYLQAMGILVLSKILFGGLRGHCTRHHKWCRHGLESMTPEERERLKEECGCGRSGYRVPDVRT